MKTVITLLILGLLLFHGEALKCRKGSGTGTSSSVTTCTENEDRCFSMITTIGYKVYLTRGCATQSHCEMLKSFFPNTNCCSTNLCN